MYKYKPKPMTKGQYEALDTLLSYVEADERQHWESVGKPDDGHIYVFIQRLLDYKYQCQVLENKADNKWPMDRADD